MNTEPSVASAEVLRERLMAPEPMTRVQALHALEIQADKCAAESDARLAGEALRFAARGIPYYQCQDPHFRDWVQRAVSYWERLQPAS